MPDYYFFFIGHLYKKVLSEVSDFVRPVGNLPIPESQLSSGMIGHPHFPSTINYE